MERKYSSRLINTRMDISGPAETPNPFSIALAQATHSADTRIAAPA